VNVRTEGGASIEAACTRPSFFAKVEERLAKPPRLRKPWSRLPPRPTGIQTLQSGPAAERAQPSPATDGGLLLKELQGIPCVCSAFDFGILRTKLSAPRRLARFVFGGAALIGTQWSQLPQAAGRSQKPSVFNGGPGNSDYQSRLARAAKSILIADLATDLRFDVHPSCITRVGSC